MGRLCESSWDLGGAEPCKRSTWLSLASRFLSCKAPGKKVLQLPVPPGDLGEQGLYATGCTNRAVAVPTGMFVGLLNSVSPFNFWLWATQTCSLPSWSQSYFGRTLGAPAGTATLLLEYEGLEGKAAWSQILFPTHGVWLHPGHVCRHCACSHGQEDARGCGAPSPGSDPTADPTRVGRCTREGSLHPAVMTASFFEISLFQIQLF